MTDAHATGWLLALVGVALLVLAALITSSCAPSPIRRLSTVPRICADGWPVRWLIDARCPDGICGYSCAPDRWRAREGGRLHVGPDRSRKPACGGTLMRVR